ncbi:hypothetical protein BP5796_02040 [Coleophoma crateriformis]|uniref:NmrA-like domain-containing protein n=1 Tax=Coleophoma crateriformis TaxID=565419 RepID=A0A3D8T264_9HELO|nr:hypothetical protein BP5796_02040 [Coleophoma crateriformis]
MAAKRVALAGATGNLGVSVLEALLGANLGVTVLSRIHGNSSKLAPHPNLTIVEVDFNSIPSLVAALQGAEVVISCLATLGIGNQNTLIDASVTVGARRFISAEFGMDSRNPRCAMLLVCMPKVDTQKYLQEKANSHPVSHIPALPTDYFWTGDCNTTTLADIAKAISGVITYHDQTANRILYIHLTTTTQNKLIQYAKDKDSRDWHTVSKDTEEIRQESLAELAKGTQGDINAAMNGFCICASWNPEYGCNFSSHLDNDLLRFKTMTEAELRTLWMKKLPSRAQKDSGHAPRVIGGGNNHRDRTHSPRASSSEILALESQQRSTDALNALSSNAESVEILLTRWGEQIFQCGFAAIFGRWAGRYGCPFVNDLASDISIAPMQLFEELDACMDKQLGCDPSHASVILERREERSGEIEQSLRRAMQSFAARWLPRAMQGTSGGPVHYEEIITERWRSSRRDMLKVINRTSYRSVLTLYLFGQTPVPSGISEEEELDGISGVSAWSDAATSSAASPNLTPSSLNLEMRAYWAAVAWDTSSSVTLNIRSSLTSGLKGACLEPAWRLVKGFLVGSFHARSEEWRKKGYEVSDETASQIISAAAICRLYTWKTIASVKEALAEGVEESDALFAWNALLDALEVYKVTIHPLLRIFQRPKIGLESEYTIAAPLEECSDPTDANSAAYTTGKPITVSLVAIDPYPHHVVASVRLMAKAINRKYQAGNIKPEAYSYLSSTLGKALEQLPRRSKTVQSACEDWPEPVLFDAAAAGDV